MRGGEGMTRTEERRYNIAPEGRGKWHTAAQIRAAAAEGMRVWLDVGRDWPRVPCRVAANVGGWVTAVSDKGGIFQAWAGEFHGTSGQAVTA